MPEICPTCFSAFLFCYQRSQIQGFTHAEMLQDIQAGKWDTKAFQEAVFISVQIPIQRLSPKNKGALPYIPLQAGYRSKKQSLTHIWLHASLWLLH
jgi:hypothetical protein